MLSVTFIFAIAMVLQIPKLNVDSNIKMIVFVAWALYGVIPTFHWHALMGGFKNPLVQVRTNLSTFVEKYLNKIQVLIMLLIL